MADFNACDEIIKRIMKEEKVDRKKAISILIDRLQELLERD